MSHPAGGAASSLSGAVRAAVPPARPAPRAPSSRPPLLQARGLVKRYGSVVALDGVDLEVAEGGFTTLLGPSGCGKTTILRLIGGFERLDAGTIHLDGVELGPLPPERRPVNTVFQSYALFPHLTVFENVAFALRLKGRLANLERRVGRALDAVHMTGFADRYPQQLSGGQQQRVAVARAIVAEPRLLLLDEPLSALDRKLRIHLQGELKALQRSLGIAFVYVTHDQEEAFALSDLVVVMRAGRIVQTDTPRRLYARPADAFVAEFIGGARLVPARVRALHDDRAEVEGPLGRLEVAAVPGLVAGGEGLLVIRPEALRLDPAGPLEGVVRELVYLGDHFRLHLEVAGTLLELACEEPPAMGTTLRLALVAERCVLTRPAP